MRVRGKVCYCVVICVAPCAPVVRKEIAQSGNMHVVRTSISIVRQQGREQFSMGFCHAFLNLLANTPAHPSSGFFSFRRMRPCLHGIELLGLRGSTCGRELFMGRPPPPLCCQLISLLESMNVSSRKNAAASGGSRMHGRIVYCLPSALRRT